MSGGHPGLCVMLSVALLACEKGDQAPAGDAAPDPAATSSSPPTSAPSGSERPSRGDGGHTASPPSSTPSASAPTGPSLLAPGALRRGHAQPSASAAPPAPPHPMAEWMRGPATDAFRSGDLEAIARSFEQMAAWAPPGYTSWASISTDGSRAARVGAIEAVKAACRGCHSQYEARYKAELATRPLP